MRKLNAWIALLLIAAPAFAQEPVAPAQALLGNINRVRGAIEQEDEKESERMKAAAGISSAVAGTSLNEMRWRVTDNVRNIREPFRCLDVDIEKNSGPVVLVCGGNSGTAAAVENNQVNSGNKFYSVPAATRP